MKEINNIKTIALISILVILNFTQRNMILDLEEKLVDKNIEISNLSLKHEEQYTNFIDLIDKMYTKLEGELNE